MDQIMNFEIRQAEGKVSGQDDCIVIECSALPHRPDRLCMRAILTWAIWLFTNPNNSSMTLGFAPAA
jgi:hypothetical protein